jgi:CPA2 family monovalent cation:H+ antiporter-2
VFAELRATGAPILVIETDEDAVRELRETGGADIVIGNAAAAPVLAEANLASARALIVAVPDPFEGGQVVRAARAVRPDLPIVARAHSPDCVSHLAGLGASEVIYGEQELARSMFEASLPKTSHAGH